MNAIPTVDVDFDPPVPSGPEGGVRGAAGDQRDGRAYVHDDQTRLAIRVAMATGRPLLISGPTGSGKSSLAASVARVKKWRYYEHVISSRTQARDLLWEFDAIRRLNDAELARLAGQRELSAPVGVPDATATARQRMLDTARYTEPGILWWAIDPTSAVRRGLPADAGNVAPAVDLNRNLEAPADARAVVLLDEIDKADPDVPNDLLVPLGSFEFHVSELDATIHLPETSPPPLILITTNGERELPAAFVRRCLRLELGSPEKPRLLQIARAHFGSEDELETTFDRLADLLATAPPEADGTRRDARGNRQSPSTAEYLDAVRACIQLHVDPVRSAGDWPDIEKMLLWKRRDTTVSS